MEILCHRGWWSTPDERNSRQALSRAFAAGLGVETDLRDLAGRIVVSHDPPESASSPIDLDELLALHAQHTHAQHTHAQHTQGPRTRLALNVKADGLAVGVAKALAEAGLTATAEGPAAYVFDMSVPDQLAWLRTGVPVFTRHSDLEPEPVLYHQADGVWLDDFGPRRWWTAATIERHLAAGKRVAVVSPELHGRDHRDAWDALLGSGLAQADGLALCTDHPAQALEAFR